MIPDFISHSEAIVKSDAEAMIYRNIEKKGNLGNMFPGIRIHADYSDPAKHLLSGVAVLKRGRNGVRNGVRPALMYETGSGLR